MIPKSALEAITGLRADMKQFADNAYCAGLRIAQTVPCLGWEQKVKDGTYGKTEHQAHRDSDNWDGKHRGAWECIRMLDTLLEDAALRSLLEPTEARAEGDYPAVFKLAETALRESARAVCKLIMEHPTVSRHASRLDRDLLEQQIFNSMKAALNFGCPGVEISASPLPKAETQPVAWRAWRSDVHFDCWVYWDEDTSDSLKDCPEYSQFQALYTHPSPQPEAATIDAEAAHQCKPNNTWSCDCGLVHIVNPPRPGGET